MKLYISPDGKTQDCKSLPAMVYLTSVDLPRLQMGSEPGADATLFHRWCGALCQADTACEWCP